MTTEQFLEKYPMVSKEDLALVTMHIRMMMQEVENFIAEDEYYAEMYKDNLDEAAYEEDEIETMPDITYVVASTSYEMRETYVFPSNEDGAITAFSEIAAIAERYGNENWDNPSVVMQQLPGYEPVKQVAFNRTLYKQII
jgi:hypothetical protein